MTVCLNVINNYMSVWKLDNAVLKKDEEIMFC